MKTVKITLIATAVSTVTGAALLFLLAFFFSRFQAVPKGIVPLINTTVWIAACLAGGFLAGRLQRERGLIAGLLAAALPALLLIILGGIQAQGITPAGIGRLAALFLSGAIGGVLGVNRKSKVKF